MKKQGFITLPILIAIVLGVVILGGGTYFVMQKKEISCPINSAWDGQKCRATGDLGHITQSVTPTQPPQDDNLITIISPTAGGNLSSDKKTTVKWDISSTTISSFPQDFNLYVMLYARRLGNEGLNYPVGDGYEARLGSAQWDIPVYIANKQLEVGTYKIVAGLQAEPKDRGRMCAETIGKDCLPSATDRLVMSRASAIKGESGWFTVGTKQTASPSSTGNIPLILKCYSNGYMYVLCSGGKAPLAVTLESKATSGDYYIDFGDGSSPSQIHAGCIHNSQLPATCAADGSFAAFHNYTVTGIYNAKIYQNGLSTPLNSITVTIQ